MITYNDIYEAARKERYSEQLQKLSKTFVQDVAYYFREKKEMAAKEDEDFSEVIVKTKKQLENAITLFRELIRRRRKKILDLVSVAAETGISKQDFENMLDSEKILFEELMKCVDSSDKKLDETLNGKKEFLVKDNPIRFKEDINAFMGLNGEKIGPYKKGDVADLPKEISKILIEGGKAEIAPSN